MGMTDIEKQALKGNTGIASELPVRVPRDRAAQLVTHRYFKVSARTLERVPLRWQRLNGKAHCLTLELFAWAEAVLAASPAVMAGGKCSSHQQVAK